MWTTRQLGQDDHQGDEQKGDRSEQKNQEIAEDDWESAGVVESGKGSTQGADLLWQVRKYSDLTQQKNRLVQGDLA